MKLKIPLIFTLLMATSHLAFAGIGTVCAKGYIVDIVGPYSGSGKSAWSEFGVYINDKPYWTDTAKFYYHDSSDIPLDTNPVGRVLFSQAQLAFTLGTQVQLSSPINSCGNLGFGTIETWR
ncbi:MULTISPECIES: hypothetical protein [Burkholderia]|uniref:hypothetical protein n=1 Tax=Burkholderia TaxID=32008 RepID=UPI000B183A46|nr:MULTISPECIES: hypothetical protein [Burkholderia]